MILDAKLDEQITTLTLVLKLQDPTQSASGKTLVPPKNLIRRLKRGLRSSSHDHSFAHPRIRRRDRENQRLLTQPA